MTPVEITCGSGDITLNEGREASTRVVANRHTPCQVEDDRLLIKRDHLVEGMLQRLGAYNGKAFGKDQSRPPYASVIRHSSPDL